jgi:ABC-type transporter Mla subunit MlaD
MADHTIVLIVDGAVLRDDLAIVPRIVDQLATLQGAHAATVRDLEGLMSMLSDAMEVFKGKLDTLVADVTALLTQPNPDVQNAVTQLQAFGAEVDQLDAAVKTAETPTP